MPEESFSSYYSHPERFSKRMSEFQTMNDKSRNANVRKIFLSAQLDIEEAQTLADIVSIMRSVIAKVDLIAEEYNMHDAQRLKTLAVLFGRHARDWFKKR